MVRRFLPGHISSPGATVGCLGLPDFRFGHGIHGGTACRHIASRGRCLSLFVALGQPPRRIDCRPGERLPRLGELSGLFRRAVGHHVCGPNLPERTPVSVRLGPPWQVAILSQGERALHSRRCRSPCHAAFWFSSFCAAGSGVGFLRSRGWRTDRDAGLSGPNRHYRRGGGHCDCGCDSSVLDRLDSLSSHADSDPASLSGKLHPESAMGSQLLYSSLWSIDSGPAVHLSARINGRSAPPFAVWLLAGVSRRTGRDNSCWTPSAWTSIRCAHHGAFQLLGDFACPSLRGALGRRTR